MDDNPKLSLLLSIFLISISLIKVKKKILYNKKLKIGNSMPFLFQNQNMVLV